MTLLRINLSRLSTLVGMTALLLVMPAVVAAQERIAYTSTANNNTDVWSMKTDGSDQRQLTANSSVENDPSFSPDGGKIAFVSSRDGNSEIYVMNADGTDQKRLTSNTVTDMDPTWSPDGKKIVFVSFRDAGLGAEIYEMNPDGTNQVNLTNAEGNDIEPAFSPDGRKIVFRALRDGGPDIYLMNADGSHQEAVFIASSIDTEPVFSPDGSKIAFRSNRDGNNEIYIMDVDGANQTNLTNTPGDNEVSPGFSPDGLKIVFSNSFEIFAMDVDGANRKGLTQNVVMKGDPSWGAANSVPVFTDVTFESSVNEGDTVTLVGEIVDGNSGDDLILSVDWGDGNSENTHLSPGPFALTHTYVDDAPSGSPDQYSLTYSVQDNRFGFDVGGGPVTVQNVNPTVSDLAVSPATVPLGSAITLSGNYSDPGYHGSPSDEQLAVTVIWGDGQTKSVTTTGAPGAFLETHQYAAMGNYTIKVQANDNDGGFTLKTIDVVISPPPPPAAPTELRVDFIAMQRIQIVWVDNSDNEDGFIIEGCAQRGCNNFIELGRVFPNIRHFVHGNLYPNTQYYYRIRSFNAGGMSAYTDVVSAKTLKK